MSASGLYFPTLEAFVADYLAETYRRPLSSNGSTWCPEWWRHPEGIIRLEALWRSWEYHRLDPATGISVWLRDHADHHMSVLLASDGPFKGCTPQAHSERPLEPLPHRRAPAEVFEEGD